MKPKEAWRESVAATTPAPLLSAQSPELMSALFGQAGIASMRAAVVDLTSMNLQSSWSLNADREVQLETPEAAPDSAFVAARDASESLRDASPEFTMLRKLSPRVWSFAWRAGAKHMVIAEARYRDRRDTLDERDTAMVRLMFLSFAQPVASEEGRPASGMPELEWPVVDRRRGRGWRSRLRNHRVPLVLLACSALLTLWLALFALPAAREQAGVQQAEAVRLQSLADMTMAKMLGAALASGDYGELQAELTMFHTLGYFPRALVVNAKARVVAAAGTGNEAPIGVAAPVALSSTAKVVPLLRGSEQVGQFLSLGKPAETRSRAPPMLWPLALLSCLATLAAAAMLMAPANWRLRFKG